MPVSVEWCTQAEEKPSGEALMVRDMPHMAQFVFDFYRQKLQQLAAQQTVSEFRLASTDCQSI